MCGCLCNSLSKRELTLMSVGALATAEISTLVFFYLGAKTD